MKAIAVRFVQDDSGATAIEYGLIASIVALGIIVSLGSLPTGFADVVSRVVAGLTG